MPEDRKSVSFPVVSGWPGWVLTAAIVLARAFQPGATAMPEWSWWSWLLMLAPVLLPAYLGAASLLLWLLSRALLAALEKASGRKA